MSPRVVGLDISLTATGVALPNGQTFTITTGAPSLGDKRLTVLRRGVVYYLDRSKPTRAMVEMMPPHMRNQAAQMAVGMAQGVVREELASRDIPATMVNPKILKQYATGSGSAEKRAMIIAANQCRFVAEETDMITDDNQADAWWLRAMGLHRLGHRVVGHLGQIGIDNDDVRDRLIRRDLGRTSAPAARRTR